MSRDDDPRYEPKVWRKRTALRISQRIMRELKPVPGLRLNATGDQLIPCTRHSWVQMTERTTQCKHCTAISFRGERMR